MAGLVARLNGAVGGVREGLGTRPAVGRVEVVELWPKGEKKKAGAKKERRQRELEEEAQSTCRQLTAVDETHLGGNLRTSRADSIGAFSGRGHLLQGRYGLVLAVRDCGRGEGQGRAKSGSGGG